MSAAIAAIGGATVLALVVYAGMALALGGEGRRLVERYSRTSRAAATGDEERIYVRRSRRTTRGQRAVLAYERPLEIGALPAAVPDDAVLPPPREVDGRNGEA